MKHFNKTLLALSITLASGQAMAAGFQLNAQSATGLGRAFAGDAVIADNASSMARNPATMALFDSTAISVGAILIDTDVTLKNAKYSNLLNPKPQDVNNVDDIGGMSVVPNIFVVHPLNDQWAVGMGIYSNFGTTTEYPDNFAADIFGGLTKVRSINFQGSVSYRLNEQWSFGAGLDIISGNGELKRNFKMANDAGLFKGPALDVEAEGYGLGWHVGTVFELDQNNHFGLSYRYSPTIKADGDFSYQGKAAADDTLHLPLPSLAEFSGWHQLTQKFALSYSAQFIHWSKFDELTTDAFGSIKTYNWRDTWHFSVGGTYTINDTWTARAGYMYDMGAVDEVQSIAIPDSDRQWFSAGLSYHLSKHSVIDFGMTYLMGEDVQVKEQLTTQLGNATIPLATITGTTRANAFLYGMQYSYKF